MATDKIIKVEMWAFKSGKVTREVTIPYEEGMSTDEILNLTYQFGQNDFQPQRCCSVSVGDIVVLPNGDRHMVMDCGFMQVPKDWTPARYMIEHGDGHYIMLPGMHDVDSFGHLIKKWEQYRSEWKDAKWFVEA